MKRILLRGKSMDVPINRPPVPKASPPPSEIIMPKKQITPEFERSIKDMREQKEKKKEVKQERNAFRKLKFEKE